ncbi:hypothetical protein AB6A40_007562 [Gnathostoma spinigerum]|uniref:Apple domain-containing protein n=1 Tax=Gnathostoma spinigerum TaxID=75299 RepID=A0ABD6ELV2_9BILA
MLRSRYLLLCCVHVTLTFCCQGRYGLYGFPYDYGFPGHLQTFGKTFYLYQGFQCTGGKIAEVRNVLDYDQCRIACESRKEQCFAINVFKLSSTNFMCEILRDDIAHVPATGAACYSMKPPI